MKYDAELLRICKYQTLEKRCDYFDDHHQVRAVAIVMIGMLKKKIRYVVDVHQLNHLGNRHGIASFEINQP